MLMEPNLVLLISSNFEGKGENKNNLHGSGSVFAITSSMFDDTETLVTIRNRFSMLWSLFMLLLLFGLLHCEKGMTLFHLYALWEVLTYDLTSLASFFWITALRITLLICSMDMSDSCYLAMMLKLVTIAAPILFTQGIQKMSCFSII